MIRIFPLFSNEATLALQNQGIEPFKFFYAARKCNVTHVVDFYNPKTNSRLFDSEYPDAESEVVEFLTNFYQGRGQFALSTNTFVDTGKSATILVIPELDINNGALCATVNIVSDGTNEFVPSDAELALVEYTLKMFMHQIINPNSTQFEVAASVAQHENLEVKIETELDTNHTNNTTIH